MSLLYNPSEKIKIKRDDDLFIILEQAATIKEFIAFTVLIILFLIPLFFYLNGNALSPCRYCDKTSNGVYIFEINFLSYIILPLFAILLVYLLIRKRKITFDKKLNILSEETLPFKRSRDIKFFSINNVCVEYRTQTKGKMGFIEFYAVSVRFGNSKIDIIYFDDYNSAEFFAKRISNYIDKPVRDIIAEEKLTEETGSVNKIIRILIYGPKNEDEGNIAKKIIIVSFVLFLAIGLLVILFVD